MNSGHLCLFHKGFCTVFLSDNEHKAVTLPHIAHIKHAFLVKRWKSQNHKIKFLKFALGLLHHRLGHISVRSLLAADTVNVWQYIELRVDNYVFCTSCKISTINKKP